MHSDGIIFSYLSYCLLCQKAMLNLSKLLFLCMGFLFHRLTIGYLGSNSIEKKKKKPTFFPFSILMSWLKDKPSLTTHTHSIHPPFYKSHPRFMSSIPKGKQTLGYIDVSLIQSINYADWAWILKTNQTPWAVHCWHESQNECLTDVSNHVLEPHWTQLHADPRTMASCPSFDHGSCIIKGGVRTFGFCLLWFRGSLMREVRVIWALSFLGHPSSQI